MDKLRAFIKRLLSYSSPNWNFEDYPIKTWKNPNAEEEKANFGAAIINWATMVGHGATTEQAIEALRENFKLYKSNNDDLPRPGTKVPLKFASTEQIDKYEAIAIDFFKRVLIMDYFEGFYSDGTYLDFFVDNPEDREKAKEEIIKRTKLIYHVDITEIYDEPLWKVFQTIKNK